MGTGSGLWHYSCMLQGIMQYKYSFLCAMTEYRAENKIMI